MEKQPKRWSADEITKFFDITRNNQFATFSNNHDAFGRYIDIDLGFRQLISDGLHHSKLWFSGFFVTRAHSAFLAATSAACSGQVVEAYALNRVVLEHALYGFFLARKPDLREVWLKRHDDEASLREVKRTFKITDMIDELAIIDANEAKVADALYQRTIDHGAHPNERALMQGLADEKMGEDIRFNTNYLFPTGAPLELCHKTTAQVGVCTLSMFRPLMKERYDVLDLTGRLDHLRKGL
ncbi:MULTISPECIES: hypothetical protein [Burkholderia]|uniref:hypothetical protein n=1 Tax=Burkholderia TaxID=32008 RepID=UPI001178B0A0|nr:MULTISPECIES: hypothetical protein [Burkholderia]MBY4728685.1 hypothetical protein [Burkholderia contaminans]MCI3967758.1 hypothetical protein [Burkholderia sp. HI4860]MDN7791381.1 hypothetical protein [Burkholderia contaminans]